MAADYQVDESETDLVLHVPPSASFWKVMVATATAGTSIWYGFLCFYLWLARSESNFAFLYCIASNVLFVVMVSCLRILYRQLAKKEVTFERHVIGIDYRMLGVRVQRQWISAHRVQEWIVAPCGDGRRVMVGLRYQDRLIPLAETLDADLWLALLVSMQRRDFVYV